MDNITHAFVGAALADCALPRGAGRTTRRAFLAVGVAGANAPDVDLLYSGIIDAPLGYLLHHRGHSHTLPGLVGLGLVLAALCWRWPAARAAMRAVPARFAALLAVGLLSHLGLDAGNSYGTHLFYPFSSAWYYGDAVFIFEPWLWLVLGVAVALNADDGWARRTAWGLTVVPPFVLAVAGLISPAVVAALTIAGAGFVTGLRRQTPLARASIAIAASAAIVVLLCVASRQANAAARDALRALDAGAVVDIVLNANPAVPWCWAAVTVERADGDAALRVRRGTVSLLPRLAPASGCASHRLLLGDAVGATPDGPEPTAWNREWRVDLEQLRELAAGNCRVGAWLQFGRVPFVAGARLSDLRFDNPLGDNFSGMSIERPPGAIACPSALTSWVPPRADVIGTGSFVGAPFPRP